MKEIERLSIGSDLLLTFLRIAECGNLTVAAGKLARTQSAVSVQLRKLEDGLGATLFTRTAKGMVLTPSGEALLPRAMVILDELAATAKLFQNPLTGSVRVGLPDDFDEAVLEQILAQFSRRHPGVQVVARSGCTSGYGASIRAGELDVAVCSGFEEDEHELLNTEEVVWAARPGSIWPTSEPLPLAVLDRTCHWHKLPMEALKRGGRPYRIVFQSGSYTSLQAALRSGIAVGVLPKSAISEGLRILTEKDGVPELPVSYHSILVSDSAPEDLAKAMVEAIHSACQS